MSAAPARTTAPTNTELAYEVIRTAIIGGELEPARRLRLGELVERYGFGAGVLREALPRLVAEGFVESRAQLGFRVVALSPAELRDLTEARLLVETEALRRSICEGDEHWEAEIVASLYLLDRIRAPRAGRADPAWLEAHRRFHAALLAACPNAYLRDLAVSMRDRGEIFRAWDQSGGAARDIAVEHRALGEAVLARDVDLAVRRLGDHISETASVFLAAADAVKARSPHRIGPAWRSSHHGC